MTNEIIALAQRLVTYKNWRWMPGMLGWRITHLGEHTPIRFVKDINKYSELADPSEVPNSQGQNLLIGSGHAVSDGWHNILDIYPDLSDPATIGCLLILVREAWKSPIAQVSPSLPDGSLWTCYINDEVGDHLFREVSEAEALIAALEAAP